MKKQLKRLEVIKQLEKGVLSKADLKFLKGGQSSVAILG